MGIIKIMDHLIDESFDMILKIVNQAVGKFNSELNEFIKKMKLIIQDKLNQFKLSDNTSHTNLQFKTNLEIIENRNIIQNDSNILDKIKKVNETSVVGNNNTTSKNNKNQYENINNSKQDKKTHKSISKIDSIKVLKSSNNQLPLEEEKKIKKIDFMELFNTNISKTNIENINN